MIAWGCYYSVHNTQALISYALHRGVIVIPKSVTPERIKSNYDAQKIVLDDEDMKKFYSLEQNMRYLRFFMMKKDQTMEDFWDMEYDKTYVVDAPDAKRTKTDEWTVWRLVMWSYKD